MRGLFHLLFGRKRGRPDDPPPLLCHWCAKPLRSETHMRAYDGMWEHESCNARNRGSNAGRTWEHRDDG